MTDKKIVGVFGTQNVGKTTFVNDLAIATKGRDCEWKLFGKDYRKEIERRGLKINRDGTEESQKVIHGILVQNVIDAADDTETNRIIMDRTPVDSYVYTLWHARFGNGGIGDGTLGRMECQVFRFCRLFDALLYIPLNKCADVEVVDDKFRDTNLEYRRQIDSIMRDMFDRLGVAYGLGGTIVDTIYGTRSGRIDMFMDKVG